MNPKDIQNILTQYLEESDLMTGSYTDIINTIAPVILSDSNTSTTIHYWTETRHKFLKRCCDANLRQFKVTVPGASGEGSWYFAEVVFENVLNDGLYIIGKMNSGHTQTHTVPDTLSENSYIEMPIWVKNLMHQVYETYKVTKNLEK